MEEEETVAMAGTGSWEEALLVLFDTAWQQGNLLTGGSGGTAGALALTRGRGGSGRQATPPVAGLRRRMESRRR
uniref:Uncharacterized protein n=1 Tax=Oryza glumipatula TaxID=40148 RepID=A0A0E0A0Q0_9ORYZ